ncbi:MAG TPA: ABC transporter ATP-binding protein, partial [Chloroflexota bacterium]|nr:ABC transporter ATP-binding protein [Chloroflexota bacterium]
VSKVFGSGQHVNVALDNFSLVVSGDQSSFTSIAGESGSGKTTLARLLLGFSEPTSGQIFYEGKDLWKMSSGEWRQFRREVQAIFQDPFEVFNPFYRVDHLLTTPIEKFHLAKSKADARTQIEVALNAVGLRPDETLGRFPHQLSGGQRQRLTIARALLLHPKLIIADEPVSMVDASLRATILESLNSLHTQFGISFIYITHDLTTAYQISDNIIVLYRGAIAEVGDVELVIKKPSHPYSRLLIASIPEPNVDQRWGEDQDLSTANELKGGANRGCKFADRCPFVMPMCVESVPPLFRTDDRRAAACFLQRESPVLAPEMLDKVMASKATAGAS